MTAELGHLSLWIALALALALSTLPLVGAWKDIPWLQAYARPAMLALCLCLSVSMFALGYAFYSHNYSIAYVAEHSNSQLPLFYRLAAIWGGHEGSLLLWSWILSLWGAAVAIFSRRVPPAMVARVLAVMGMVSVGFLLFMLLTSNPFARDLPWFALDGADLNPLLQDPGLVVHPPMLYMGYVGFSVAFAFAIGGLLAGKLDPDWARWARPWTTVAWCFLTVGIALGSWWAYNELGWGGWWFWDPVENASLMPWLAGTALIHSLAVTEKRGMFRAWTALLAIIAFSLSLLGTFLVRSGVLTSVHAFANDPKRGAFVLAFLVVVAGGALTLFAFRAPALKSDKGFKLISRESFLLVNNLVLLTAAFVVVTGTVFPIIAEALHMRISIRAPYFNTFFPPLALILLLALVPGVFSNWKRQDGRALLRRFVWLAPAAIVGGWIASRLPGPTPWPGVLALMLALFVVLSHLDDLTRKALGFRSGFFRGVGRLSRGYKGMVLAHCGLAVVVTGITLVSYHEVERDVRMKPGDTATLAGYQFHFDNVVQRKGPNYQATRGDFTANRNGRQVATLHPEKRRYNSSGQVMTEAAVDIGLFRDLYVAMGEPLKDQDHAWAVRLYYKPGVRWIWIGALIMAIGGGVALSDRRYRRSNGNRGEDESGEAA